MPQRSPRTGDRPGAGGPRDRAAARTGGLAALGLAAAHQHAHRPVAAAACSRWRRSRAASCRSVPPTRSRSTTWIAATSQGRSRRWTALGLFDVFGSPWFTAIYILLFISLIGCVLPRIAAHWPRHARRRPRPRRAAWTGSPAPRRWQHDEPTTSSTQAAADLRAQRWRVTPGETAGGVGSLAAETGFARETGNLLFHVALVLILLGVALGSLLGWKGSGHRPRGQRLLQHPDPVRLVLARPAGVHRATCRRSRSRCRDFDATFERTGSQRGAPRSFTAELEYHQRPGRACRAAGRCRSTLRCGWTGRRSTWSATATPRTCG